MKILHIVEDFSIDSGGLRTVIKDLNFFLNQHNHDSSILTSRKEDEDKVDTVEVKNNWLYSKKWNEFVKKHHQKNKIDIVHIHGVWLYPQYAIARICDKLQIPFILSVHGMYEPWLWEKGALKKKLYFNLLSKITFKKASCIHAITHLEKKNLTKFFFNNRIVEIPNLIQVDNLEKVNYYQKEEKYILYLGRLDQKKGIDLLIKAFSKIKDDNVILKIAGSFNTYKEELEQLISKYNLKTEVKFLGQVKGKNKIELIKNAFVLVAPSHSEVIGMVNLEAGILGTPVITTHQTGIHKLWDKNGGKLINPTNEELSEALNESISISNDERIKRGKQLQKFVSSHYSWLNKYSEWENLYKSIIYKSNNE